MEHTSSHWNPSHDSKNNQISRDGMNRRLASDDEVPITYRVKQECVLAPTHFSFLFSTMLLSALKDPDIQITCWTDGGIFNTQHPKAKMKVTNSLVRNLLYADGCAVVAHSEEGGGGGGGICKDLQIPWV